MMRRLLKVFLVLVLIVVLAIVAVFLFIDQLAKRGVEQGGSYALGVPTLLQSADVKVFAGEFSMKGLNVANPQGFATPHFLSLNEGDVSVTLGSLTKDVVELPTLTLSGIDVNLEKKDAKSNYSVILDNLKKLESGESKPAKTEGGKKFIVRKVVIRDVKAHVDLLPIGGGVTKLDVPIDEITMTDVGSDGSGVNMGQLIGVLTKAVFMAILQKGGDLIPKDITGELGNALSSLGGLGQFGVNVAGQTLGDVGAAAGKVLEGGGDVGKGAGDALKGAGEKAGEALKGLGGLLGGQKKEEPK